MNNSNANLILAESRLLTLSFERFIAAAWSELEGTEFIHVPHVTIMARHLQAAAKGEISRLLCNVPPECTKSSVFSIMFPAWVYTWKAEARFIFQSYNLDFTLRDAAITRRLLESNWYRSRWPHVVLEDDDNKKSFYKTTAGGYRLSTSRGSRATGEHPDFIIFEDPLSVDQASSKLELSAWRDWYAQTISSRGVSRGSVHIISQQRLHPDDPSSIALDQNRQAELEGDALPWHHIMLPMRFESDRAMRDRGYGGDWRTREGELLFPQVFTDAKVKQTERGMGPRAARAQLQQDPQHSTGQMFAVDKLIDRSIPMDSVPKMQRVVRGVDRAGTKNGGCYTASVLLGIKGEQVFILDVMRGQWAPDEVLNRIHTGAVIDANRHGATNTLTVIEQEPGSGGKESVEFAIRRLKGHRVKAMKATTNKESRAEPLANAIAFGEVYIVQASWTAEFIADLRDFPAGKYKDQVDASSLAYLALVEQTVQPPRAIMAGMTKASDLCAGGCGRPIQTDAEYCCPCCEAIAAFNDPTMQLKGHEHDQSCIQRYFIWSQDNPLPDYSESESFPMRGLGGLANWRR